MKKPILEIADEVLALAEAYRSYAKEDSELDRLNEKYMKLSRTAAPELANAVKELHQELSRCVHVIGEALSTPDCPAAREYIGLSLFSARALLAKLGVRE